MDISKDDYFFYEWLIIQKQMTIDVYKKLSAKELIELKVEFNLFYKNLNKREILL